MTHNSNVENSPEVPNIGSNLREESSSSDSEDIRTPINQIQGWTAPRGNHLNFQNGFTQQQGIRPELSAALQGGTPYDFFLYFWIMKS